MYNGKKYTEEKHMSKSKYITRLKRSEGQLRGIQKMIEEERDCMDIMIQLSAVRSLRRILVTYSTERTPNIKTVWGLGYKMEKQV